MNEETILTETQEKKRELWKIWYKKNHEAALESKRKRYQRDKEKILAKRKTPEMRKKLAEKARVWRSNPENAEKHKQSVKKYNQLHPDKVIEVQANWKKNHKEKYLAGQRRYIIKNKEKKQSRLRATYLKLKMECCIKCGSTEELHFHHTNYSKDEGMTLCKPCHLKEHGGRWT